MDGYGALRVLLPGAAHDLEEMLLVRVDALVLEEAEEVQNAPVGLPARDESDPLLHAEKRARPEAVVDALELLDHDAAGAHVQVPDLGGALVPVGKPDGLARALQRRPGVRGLVGRDVRRLGGGDGVALGSRVEAPAVAYDQDHGSHGGFLSCGAAADAAEHR